MKDNSAVVEVLCKMTTAQLRRELKQWAKTDRHISGQVYAELLRRRHALKR